MTGLNEIQNIIRHNQAPYLYLYHKRSALDSSLVGKFETEICSKEATTEEKTEKAIEWLVNYIETNFPENANFSIICKTGKTGNQGGVFGPLEFSKKSENKENLLNGLNGLNPNTMAQMGYLTNAEVELKLLQMQQLFDAKLKDREIEDLKAKHEIEIENVKNIYDKWTPEKVDGLFDKAVGLAGMILNKTATPTAPIAGTNEEIQEPSLQEIMVQKTTRKIEGLQPQELKILNNLIDGFLEKIVETRKQKNENSEKTENKQNIDNQTTKENE